MEKNKTEIQDKAALKRKAQVMFFAGYKVSEIAKELDLKPNTIYSWKKRGNWEDKAPVGRVEMALESRICLLILKEDKTPTDTKELDALMKQMERTARIKKYSFGEGEEGDLNPRVKKRGRKKQEVSKQNPITPEQEDLLKTGFLKGMFHYQRIWYEAGLHYRIRNILKSRQIGATYYFAHEAFVDALTSGRNQIFLSASKKQALMFRSYIVSYAKQCAEVELKGETIKLPNGAELYFLGTNSATAQSYHGNLYFDEIFWVRKFDEMRKVASGMASQKQYRQTYFSTPTTKAHPAYDFWSGKNFNRGRSKKEKIDFDISHGNLVNGKLFKDGQWRQIVNILDAERGGCNLFDIDALRLEYSEDEFEQLFMCEFADDEATAFRFSDLQNCLVDSMEDWTDYRPFDEKRPFGNKEVWLGYDPAYTGDRAALAIIAPPTVEGGIYRILHTQTYHGEDYEAQAKIILDYCEKYKVTKINIDATGMGQGVYQELRKIRPDAKPLKYTVEMKNEMVLKTRNLIQKRRLQFDGGDNEIIMSLLTVKRQSTRSGLTTTYVSDRTAETSHGDIAWAIMNTILNVEFGESTGGNTSSVFIYS